MSEYARDQAHTNGIESFQALLKLGYHGAYHHMPEKRLDLYAGEFSGRYNQRDFDMTEQMELIVKGLACKRLKHHNLVT